MRVQEAYHNVMIPVSWKMITRRNHVEEALRKRGDEELVTFLKVV